MGNPGSILTAQAGSDYRRHGHAARRWREYLFLIACSAAAAIYAALNDQITSCISWEYFYYAKDLWRHLGPVTPPPRAALSLGAAKVGATAGWSVGLLLGAALLIANNPRKDAFGKSVAPLSL